MSSTAGADPIAGRIREPAALAVVVVAAVLRLRQYAVGRAFWHDEAMLALGIREETLTDLVAEQLPRAQVAPPGFLVVEKLLASISVSDQWLRILPLLASFGLIWLAWHVATSLRSTPARLTFLVIVTWSPVLVYYSSELKQYGLDATASLALVVGYLGRERHRGRLVAIGIAAVLFSHPAVIVLAAISVVMGVEALRADGLAGVRRLWPHVLGWGSAAAVMALQIRQTSNGDEIEFFWADSFAPLPNSTEHLRWWWESALGLVHLTSTLRGVASQQRLDAWTEPLIVASLAVVVAAAVVVARRRFSALAVPAATLLLSLGLAGFEIYPFRGRLILFLIPLVALVVAHGLDEIDQRMPRVAWVLCAVVVAQFAWTSSSVLRDPDDRFDIVEALGRLEADLEPGDVIVLGRGSGAAFDWYGDDFDLGEAVVVGVESYEAAVVVEAGGGAPVWFLASHVLGRDADAVAEMDRSDAITDSWTGDSVLLRRFSAGPLEDAPLPEE